MMLDWSLYGSVEGFVFVFSLNSVNSFYILVGSFHVECGPVQLVCKTGEPGGGAVERGRPPRSGKEGGPVVAVLGSPSSPRILVSSRGF